jgi:methionyl-tRNA formyltransferase
MDALESGALEATPQSVDGVTHAPRIEVDDARIDWSVSAQDIDRLVRAMSPAPGAWTTLRGERIKIGEVEVLDGHELEPGEIRALRAAVQVGTATHDIAMVQVQAPGKRPMSAADWARGMRLDSGERFA